MSAAVVTETRAAVPGAEVHARSTLAAAVLGFFVITLDATIVNVALPSIRSGLGGGITGLQWVVDGYTLMFAALLLSAGALSDRVGAKRAFGGGLLIFAGASVICGVAPSLAVLVAARFLQGVGAAVVMPASMALVRHAYDDPAARGRAVAVWAMGGAVAAAAGPVLGGLLSLASWRLIFWVNVPVVAVTLALLARTRRSPHHVVPFDWTGQVLTIAAMGALTFGAIDAGPHGLTSARVVTALAVAVLAGGAFVLVQARGTHPMVPLSLFRSATVNVAVVIGFVFMVGFYGLPFLFSLYFQTVRGLSPLAAGVAFLPMMLLSAAVTPFTARIVERVGPRVPVVAGAGVAGRRRDCARRGAGVGAGLADGAAAGPGRADRAADHAAHHCGAFGECSGPAGGCRLGGVQHQSPGRWRARRRRLRGADLGLDRVPARGPGRLDHHRRAGTGCRGCWAGAEGSSRR